MEVLLSGVGLLLLSPLLLIIAIVIKLTGRGPVFFRQRRLGQQGRPFELVKFRSMVERAAGGGPLVTAGDDGRITPLGRILRRTKLDELPQLWNVLRGDMSLVGPRPEVPRYVAHYPELFDLVLCQRPGITDVCTLQLRNEEQILAGAADPERYYVEKLLPRKLAASIREGWRRTAWRDLRVLVATVVPGLRALAPLPDFRPMAELYNLPATPSFRIGAEPRGRAVVGGGHDVGLGMSV
jgi:lipopolysaccharide/colanic/teichoic acid biosynthesis glycosyltransferase